MESSKLLERLARTELGRQLLAEETAEVLEHRRELAAEVERLTVELEAALPALQNAEQKALATVERAREKLRAAQEAHGQAVAAQAHAINSHDMRRTRLESELYTTAPPAIGQFRGWLQDLFDSLRRQRFYEAGEKRDALGNPIAHDGPTAYEMQAKRMAAVQGAMRQAEALMLEALSEDELAEKLEALRASTDGK